MESINGADVGSSLFSQITEVDQRISAYRNSPDRRELDLSDLGLTEVPPEVFTFRDLESLNLSGNALDAFPVELQDLTFLTNLDVSHNQIREIPQWVKGYEHLEMDSNSFPEGMQELYQNYGIHLTELNHWAMQYPVDLGHRMFSQRPEAVKAMIKYAMDPEEHKLDFQSIKIDKLPLGFCKLHDLKVLNLNGNRLQRLPDEFDQLQALESLDLSCGTIPFLPCITNLKNLERLYVRATATTKIPQTINCLKNLLSLDIGSNRITELPDEIGGLNNLRFLRAQQCFYLKSHPETLANLSLLKDLDFDGCIGLKINGEILGKLENLEALNLNQTLIDEIPQAVFNLQLEELKLHDCKMLRTIPLEITKLPEYCKVDLSGTKISEECLAPLMDAANRGEYIGPSITLPFRNEGGRFRRQQYMKISSSENGPQRLHHDINRINSLIGRLCQPYESSIAFNNLITDAKNAKSLADWLERLKNISAIYKNKDIKDFFISNILTYIQEANDNPEFREKFFIRLDKAATTCGDRMALSAIHLGLDYELLKLDLHDLHSVALFLGRGAWAVQMLEDIARETAQRLKDQSVDFQEVEHHLAYLVRLKEELNLPLNQKEMLFFKQSGVTEENLAEAKDFVLSCLSDKGAYSKFLVGHDTWMEALRLNYPARMGKIEAQRDAFINLEDYDGYTQLLTDLTDEVLSAPSLIEQERALKAEQDAEYEAALALDRRRETLLSLGEELSRATEELAGLREHVAPFKTCCEAFNTHISRKGPAALRGEDVERLLERLERQVAGIELVMPNQDAFKERVAEFDELNGAYQTYCAALERVQYPQHWNLLKKQFSELGGEQLLKTLRNDEQRPFWQL